MSADHEASARSLRGAIELCQDQFNDAGTADFLTGMLQGHDKMAWMLRSFLIGSGVQPSGEATRSIRGETAHVGPIVPCTSARAAIYAAN